MMDRKWKAAGLVVLAVLPLLIAASGGFPSRPRFTSVSIGTPNTGLAVGELYAVGQIGTDNIVYAGLGLETDEGGLSLNGDGHASAITITDELAASDNRRFRVTANGGDLALQACTDLLSSCTTGVVMTRTSNTVDSLDIDAAAITLDTTATAGVTMNGATIPRVCAFDAVVSASPSITNAWNCSPSIARNSAGNFTVTHNFASANQYITLCTQRGSTSGTPGLVSIQSQSSNSMILRTYDHTGTLSDSLTAIQCVVVRFLFA